MYRTNPFFSYRVDPASTPTYLMSIAQHLRRLAAQQPDNPLYEWFERTSDGDITIKHSFSYRQSWQRVSTLALHLIQEHGLTSGDRVLLCYPPCVDFLFAFLGCILANVIPVPAYPPNPQALKATIPAFAKIKTLANARIVLTNKQYSRWTSLSLFAAWPSDLKWVVTDTIFTSRTAPPDGPWKNGGPADTAFLQFTSGSTGDPKGVMISHRALWEDLRGITACESTRILPTDPRSIGELATLDDSSREPRFTVVSWLPLYHDFGLIFAALLPIYRAGNALLCSPLDFVAEPHIWLLAMSKYKATVSCAPNFAFDLVVRRWQSTPPHQRKDLDLSCIRFIASGGEAVRAKSLIDFTETFKPYGFNGHALCPSYGFAEFTVAACAEYSTEIVFSKRSPNLVSCGSNFARSGSLVAILKRARRLDDYSENSTSKFEVAEEGEIGEIIVTGNALSSGYWTVDKAPEKAPQVFIPKIDLPSSLHDLAKSHPEISSDFWFATGDLGLLEEGHLYVTGRIKEIIVIRGRNYVATDIEDTVMTSTPEARPGCIAAVAVSGSSSATEEALILCETRSSLPDGEARNVIGKIRSRIGEVHGINALVELLEKGSLPKTSSGKLQRMKAAEMWKMGSLKPSAFGLASSRYSVTPSTWDSLPTLVSHESQAPQRSVIPNLDPGEVTEDSESSAWDSAATYSDRFSALHAQICRITKAHFAAIESSSETDVCRDVVNINTEWTHLGLDSLSAVLIMQDLQDEANKVLKECSTPIVLSPSLLYEHKDVKALIQHLISLHGCEDARVESTHETPDIGSKPGEPDTSQKRFEHAFELPQPVSSSSYVAFAAAQAVWTCIMWSATMYAASFALSFESAESLGPSTIVLPLVHFCFLFSLAIATVLLKKSIIGVYQPGCHPQYGEYHLRYWMVESAVNVVELLGMNYLHNTKAYEVYLGLLGVNVSPGASIDTSINTAFDLLTVGPDSMIERCSTISCHSYQAGCFYLNRVNIGQLAIVEQRAVIQSSATVWTAGDPLKNANTTLVGCDLFAFPPSPYVQGHHTVLRHGSRQASIVQRDDLSHATSWKIASGIPMLRWAYSIGLFWLTDMAVALAALASLKITGWMMAHTAILPLTWVRALGLGFDQVVGGNYAFTFVFGPHLIFPNLFLLSQGTAALQHDNTPTLDFILFDDYGKVFSAKVLGSLLFTLAVIYLVWVMAMAAITLATQHLLVPPIRHGDIIRQHSYSAFIRHLYANLVQRLHSLSFFFTTGKLVLQPLFRIYLRQPLLISSVITPGTVLTTAFYRLSGAKIGRRVLFALTEPIVEPGLLIIEDGCFIGDFSHISSFSAISSSNGGAHRASLVHLEEGSLVGMNAVVQANVNTDDTSNQNSTRLRLPRKCIVGANSTLDQKIAQSMEQSVNADGRGISFFGRHTFKQEASDSPALPAWSQWWSILYNAIWPVFILPALLSWFILSLLPSLLLTTYLYHKCGPRVTMALTGPLYTVYAVCVLSQLIIGKWILVSKLTQKVYNIDSVYFLRRLAYAQCLDFAALFCLGVMKGTSFLPMVYNLLGARIGSRVHLDTLAITEPDLCEIQDNCSISSSAVLFGHSLDRGLFSQAPLKIGTGSTMDNHSLLLLGTTLGSFTHLQHSSATLMHSVIAGSSTYAGVPPQVQQSSAALADEYRAWKNRTAATTEVVHNLQPATQMSPLLLTSTASSVDSPSSTMCSVDSRIDSQSDLTSDTLSDDAAENSAQATYLQRREVEKQPMFKSQYKGTRPEYRNPETLDQPKSNNNIPALIDVFSATRDKAHTSLKAIGLAFEEEVNFWQEQFSAKLTELHDVTPEVKDTLIDLGRHNASTEDLETLVTDVRNLPGSGDSTFPKAQDATLTDWAEHRQQLSVRAERMRTPKPYTDHSAYADKIQKTYSIVALDLFCQGEVDWMLWQSFSWVVRPGPFETSRFR